MLDVLYMSKYVVRDETKERAGWRTRERRNLTPVLFFCVNLPGEQWCRAAQETAALRPQRSPGEQQRTRGKMLLDILSQCFLHHPLDLL